MSILKKSSVCMVIMAMIMLISGCSGQQIRARSSVVDYLYPKGTTTAVQPSVPTLTIPLKVGIAFVPDKLPDRRGLSIWSGVVGGGSMTEAEKSNLLGVVADHFRKYEFVSDIEVIPSTYLMSGGGFKNLDQIRSLFGVDVIALVSYDQVQFTDEGLLSFTYWTLIGAYVVSGEKNDTSTMLDTVVYDIPSRKLLFRAPGTSNIKGRSTPVNLSEELRKDSVEGFKQAAKAMAVNLDLELSKFREKVKADPEKVKIVHREGYSGGGAFGVFEFIFLLLLFCFKSGRRKRYSRDTL